MSHYVTSIKVVTHYLGLRHAHAAVTAPYEAPRFSQTALFTRACVKKCCRGNRLVEMKLSAEHLIGGDED